MRKFFLNNLNGILGTLAFHLVLLILFLSFQLNNLKHPGELKIEIELPEETQVEEIRELTPEERADQVIRRNIGVNVAEKLEEELNTEHYAEEIQKELEMGNPDRIKPEDIKKIEQKLKNEDAIAESVPVRKNSGPGKKYTGPTNIEYDLKGRHDTRLYVPVYLCEGKGKVVINITVNQKGYVVNASVSSSFSEVHDECLFKAATDAALKTRFNIDLDVSDNQKGSITYYFVAQ